MRATGSDMDMLAQFVATFEKFDCLCNDQAPSSLLTRIDADGVRYWQPRQITTSPSTLEGLYRGLGLPGTGSTRFPPLFEMLVLSYRWTEVDLGAFRLLKNEPAEDLLPLLSAIRHDVYLFRTLIPNGYVQFGMGPDLDYDPVCFDFRARQKNGDCRIVKLDHEAILTYDRIGKITELAPNFRSLVLDTIQRAASQQNFPSDTGNPDV
jgi:hypothetical protein